MHAAREPWGTSLGLWNLITMAVKESGKRLIRKRLSELAEGQVSVERERLVVRAEWGGTQALRRKESEKTKH